MALGHSPAFIAHKEESLVKNAIYLDLRSD